jgi:hypothetical protein
VPGVDVEHEHAVPAEFLVVPHTRLGDVEEPARGGGATGGHCDDEQESRDRREQQAA